MLTDGVQLMVVGMGTVFAFLGLLVLLMRVSSSVIAASQPAPLLPAAPTEDEEEIAVALAAIAAARQNALHGRP